MILVDENIHYFIIKKLRESDFNVISVNEVSKGIKDEKVITMGNPKRRFYNHNN